MESIQKFYSLIFQKQMYFPDPKIKSEMSTPIAVSPQNHEDLINRKTSFNDVVRRVKTTWPVSENNLEKNESNEGKPKKITLPFVSKFLISMIGLSFFWLVVILLACLLGDFFVCKSEYSKIAQNVKMVSYLRLFILEVNVAPRVYAITESNKSDSPMTHPLDELLDHRNQILKSIYTLISEAEQNSDFYLNSFKRQVSTYMTQNITDLVFKDNQFASSFFTKNIQLKDIGGATFTVQLMNKAKQYVQTSQVEYNQTVSLTNNGLKYVLLSNINMCDNLLKSGLSGSNAKNNRFNSYLESFNLKLLFLVSYCMEVLSASLADAFVTFTIVQISILSLILVLVLLCIAAQILNFRSVLRKEMGYTHYIQNNILNFIDAEIMVENDEVRNMIFSETNYFKIDF
jgi:hypothetical protein